MGEKAEGVGVAVEVDDVVPDQFALLLATFTEDEGTYGFALAFVEETGYGAFAGVPEGWVAQIVGEAGATDDRPQGVHRFGVECGVAAQQFAGGIGAKGTAYAGYFERVGETVVDKNTAGQGEYLGLVLHPTKGGREDEAVVVALKFSATFGHLVDREGLSEPFSGHQLLPIHLLNHEFRSLC